LLRSLPCSVITYEVALLPAFNVRERVVSVKWCDLAIWRVLVLVVTHRVRTKQLK
jgi:hypothetical protein